MKLQPLPRLVREEGEGTVACRLPAAVYTWALCAMDLAGTPHVKAGAQTLVVRRAAPGV